MQLIYNNLGIFVLLVSSFIDISIAEPRVVCYYTNWSVYRPGTAKFNPQNINPYLCTHLIYAFGGFTKDNQLKPFDKYQDIEQGGYAKFTGLKTYNKELKTMLAIGGWNEGSTRFSPLVASADRRGQLVKNTIKFLRQNKFDGLDLDWEYPAFRDGGKSKDRENYAKLVQELREEFDREHQKTGRPRLLLTMAVPAGFEYIDKGYDVPKLNKYLDWFNLLSYDYHSAYEPSVNHHAPLYPIEEENEYSFDNDLNINATINYYLKSGAERDKLVLGLPTYGRSYTLFNPDSNEIGAPADGPGEQGDATREKGYLAYYEICQSLKEEDSEWTVVQPNPDALGPYAYKDNQWVGYDDEAIVRRKSEFVVEQKLGGIMFWSIDNDDFRGLCDGKPYPLIEAAKESYLDGLENGVQRKSQYDANKRKQQTTTRKPDAKKNAFGKTTPSPPTTPSSGSDFKCEEEGFFPHPSDCAKYFWCLEAPGLGVVAHHFSCPSGLVFNKAADSCDYARNVYCSNKAPKTTTSTTTEVPTTSRTTEKVSYNKVSTIYKNPSRTTPRTTTPVPIEIDSADLEQEDPKVIKELIELIKKAGGIEELEKQLNIHEDSSNGKSDQKISTGTTATINKSLVDKIKNRGSLFKSRPPLFNGASQPERISEQKVSTEQKTSTEKIRSESNAEKQQTVPKKYNAINRFSRPEPQSAGIDKIPESDAVLIEKPQYTSIARRKPVKPEVIAENDYNNDSDRTSEEESKSQNDSEITKKYTSISRTRKPSQPVLEEIKQEEDSEEDDEDIVTIRSTTATVRPTANKYVNLSRRRSTTALPEEKASFVVETTTSPQVSKSSVAPPRRRLTTTEAKTTTSKTVLEIDTNIESQTLSENIFDNTLSKNTATDIERDTLIANKHIHDDDINHIALPTESVTENIQNPESVTNTQILNTFPPQFNANDDKVNDLLNEILDSKTESSDFDITTVINEFNVDIDDGLSEESVENSNRNKNNFIAPRPFTRTKPSQKTTSSPLPTRNLVSRPSTEARIETTRSIRRRPTFTRASTTAEFSENDFSQTPRQTYSYRPGYRGTARFRPSTTRSGEYEHDYFDAKNEFLNDNRLRALNRDRTRPSTVFTTTEQAVTAERTTRRRPTITRTKIPSTTTPDIIDESTPEANILQQRNRFNLDPNERPERVRFELAAGGKINFGFSSVKSKEKSSLSTGDSKQKVITGPLEKSPLIISGRELRKGHVEEIPIQTSPESVTVQNFSDKLDLSEIPLKESDIDAFVPDSALRNESSIDEETTTTTRFRPRPSKAGFVKRPTVIVPDVEVTTFDSSDELDTTTEKLRNKFTRTRSQKKLETSEGNSLTQQVSRQTFTRTRPSSITRTKINSEESKESSNGFVRKSQVSVDQNSQVDVSSPRSFTRRLPSRIQKVTEDKKSEVSSTTFKYLTKVKASEINRKVKIEAEDNENSETQDVPEESTLRTYFQINRNKLINKISDSQEDTTIDSDVLEMITENPTSDDQENEIDFTTAVNDEYEITENPVPETTSSAPTRRTVIRKKPAKKTEPATRQTITEAGITSEIEHTSSLSVTADSDDEEFETKIEIVNQQQSPETSSIKPSRRVVVNRKRVNTNNESSLETDDSNKDEKVSLENTSTAPRQTRKRILTIRTKTGVIHSPVEIGIYETTEASTEAPETKITEPDVNRRRIKVFRSRATTEGSTEESSTFKSIVARTRVFKRPVAKQEKEEDLSEAPESSIDEISTSERTRFTQRTRKIVKTRRPLTTSAPEDVKVQDEEVNVESSTTGARRGGFTKRVLKTKTPRLISTQERPLEEDQSVIKTDDESQQIDQQIEVEEQPIEKEENIEVENQEVSSEEPSSPIIRIPTRPAGRISVTVRKRPTFNPGFRTSTVHPASTRFAKEGGTNALAGRIRKVTTRRLRPGTADTVIGEIGQEKKFSIGERKKIFSKTYRKTSTSTSTALPNITPHNIDIETETNEYDEAIDSTDIPQITNNENGILQTIRPRFPLSRFTTSTTSKPTTLHHVFAIDIEQEDMNKLKNSELPENQADEVIKKLQKLIEINRIVEVYSKEEKLKLLKNKKLKSIKAGELTLERPPALDKFGEITRQVIIKLSVKPNITALVNTTTETPNDSRSPKNVMFSETVFGKPETSTISLEGLFEREKKELELKKDEISTDVAEAVLNHVKNKKNPLLIENIEQVILSKIQEKLYEKEATTTESLDIDEETTTLVNDD